MHATGKIDPRRGSRRPARGHSRGPYESFGAIFRNLGTIRRRALSEPPKFLLGPPTPRVSPWKNFGSAVWNLRSWCVEEFVWIFLWPISLEIEGRKSPENFAKISPRFSSVSLKNFSKNFTWISLWGTIGITKRGRKAGAAQKWSKSVEKYVWNFLISFFALRGKEKKGPKNVLTPFLAFFDVAPFRQPLARKAHKERPT